MIQLSEVELLGELRKMHGTRGEMLLQYRNEQAAAVAEEVLENKEVPLILSVDNLLVPFYVAARRQKSFDSDLVLFDDVSTEQQQQRMLGSKVYIENKYIEEYEIDSKEDSYRQFVELGYSIEDEHAGNLGKITDFDDSTTNWLFELESGLVVPAHEDMITAVDDERKVLITCFPEGLVGE